MSSDDIAKQFNDDDAEGFVREYENWVDVPPERAPVMTRIYEALWPRVEQIRYGEHAQIVSPDKIVSPSGRVHVTHRYERLRGTTLCRATITEKWAQPEAAPALGPPCLVCQRKEHLQ